MTRRLQMAGVALSAFLVPACMAPRTPTEPYYTQGGSGYVILNRPGQQPIYRKAPADAPIYAPTGDPVASQRFGTNAPIVQAGNTVPQQPAEIAPPERPVRFDQNITVAAPIADDGKLSVPVKAAPNPPIMVPSDNKLIAPPWPQLGPANNEPAAVKSPNLLPRLEPAPVTAPMIIQPLSAVPPLEPVAQPVRNVALKVAEPTAPTMAAPNGETVLVRTIQAFQTNRPEEAIEILKSLDSTNQEVLMYLMPLMVRIGEGNINALPPDELAAMIDRLQTAATMLKSKAALRVDRVCICRGVRKFADVDPYDPRHEFRPGDMVFLYAELKNFTCEPMMSAQRQPTTPSRGFNIRLGTTLELRDARNSLVWRTDLNKTDFAQTPPQDYYHTYRFCVPEKLPAGTYTLWISIVDKPTNRIIRKPIELRVGQS